MKATPASRELVCTAIFYYVTILVSAAIVVSPALRLLPAAKLSGFLVALGMLVVLVRRERRRKTLGLTMAQIYVQAKQGRKFAPPGIELAAITMWCWSTYLVN
jgi:hypothetical protein